MKHKRNSLLYSFLLVTITCTSGQCKPCDPTDPLGRNPSNLCPRYPYSSINDNTFTEGVGLPITTIPSVQNPAGIVIHQPSGHWTNIRTTQQKRNIKDSGGNTYILPNQNRMGRR